MSASPCALNRMLRGCCIVAVVLSSFSFGDSVYGQTAQMTAGVKPPDNAPVDVSKLINEPQFANRLRQLVIPVLSVGKASNQQEADNVDMWTVFRAAQLTLPPTDARDTVEQRRMQIKSRELLRLSGNAPDQTLHDRINAVLVANLVPVIGNAQYSMEARYNAMLLLGMLDKVEPDSTQNREAVPLAAAEPLLIQASQSEALPEILRLGALGGLARHCELQLPGDNKAAIAAEAVKLLAAKQAPNGYSPNGFHWARKQAIQMVIGLATKGAEVNRPEVVKALYDILADDKQPLFLRRDAALAFGYLDTAVVASGGIKPADICKAMTNYTLEVMKAGSPRFDPTAPIDLSKGEDVFPTPTEENKLLFAQGVAYYLNCAATGLGGRSTNRGLAKTVNAADPAFQQVNTLLNTHINPLITALNSPRVNSSGVMNDLASKRGTLEQWFQQNGGAAGAGPAGAGPGVGAAGALGAPVAPR